MRSSYGIIICFLLVFSITAWGQGQPEARKYSNEFLKIGVGARAFGMGNAQVGIANDVTAGYWNPAGLAASDAVLTPEVSLMHSAYFANIAAYNYGGFSLPLNETGSRRFGLTFIRLGVDDIPNTLNLIRSDGSFNYDAIESFSATDLATMLSYAWRPGENLSVGASVKVIYRGAGRFANAWGFGLDLGLMYKLGGLSLGLVLTDATNTFNAWTFNTATFEQAFINTGNEIPQNSVELTRPTARVGIGYDLRVGSNLSFLVAVDNDFYFDGPRSAAIVQLGNISLDPRAGVEVSYVNDEDRKVASLRGGVYNLQNIKDLDGEDATGLFPTVGAGIWVGNFQIDYALANIGNLSENLHSHVISLKLQFK